MITLTLIGKRPHVNPDTLLLQVGFSNNYVPGGDAMSLAPASILDPSALGVTGLNQNPIDVAVDEESIGGYYVEPVRAAAQANWKLQGFAAGGAELGAAPYPGGMTGAQNRVVLAVKLANTDC